MITAESVTHRDAIEALIRAKWGNDPAITFVEIGVMFGDMERQMKDAFPRMNVIGIDPTMGNYSDHNRREGITLVEKNSNDACADFKPESIDFVYIDGDHSYEQCKRDIINYLPLVKAGGIIGGHDYGIVSGNLPTEPFPGVRQAVEEVLGKVNVSVDYMWYKEL